MRSLGWALIRCGLCPKKGGGGVWRFGHREDGSCATTSQELPAAVTEAWGEPSLQREPGPSDPLIWDF